MDYESIVTPSILKSWRRTVEAIGTGTIQIEPDIAILKLGVVTEDPDISIAQKENKQIINNIIGVLKKYGISDEDIKTIRYNVQPMYDYVDGVRKFRGYEIAHVLEVTVRNIEYAGIILEEAIEQGVNRETALRFEISNREQVYQEALNIAVVEGREKAREMVNSLGYNIKDIPISVKEITKNNIVPMGEMRYATNGGVPIQSGILQVIAVVQEVFDIIE